MVMRVGGVVDIREVREDRQPSLGFANLSLFENRLMIGREAPTRFILLSEIEIAMSENCNFRRISLNKSRDRVYPDPYFTKV